MSNANYIVPWYYSNEPKEDINVRGMYCLSCAQAEREEMVKLSGLVVGHAVTMVVGHPVSISTAKGPCKGRVSIRGGIVKCPNNKEAVCF